MSRSGTLLPPVVPSSRRSPKSARPSIGIAAPAGGEPTITQRPPAQVDANASRDEFGTADHLERHVDPTGHHVVHGVDDPLVPGRRGRGWHRGARASASFLGLASSATIVVAPAIRAPCTTLSPTPPQPTTATDSPGCTSATLNTDPSPVVTPHPARQITSSGSSGSTFTICSARSTATLGEAPDPHHGVQRRAAEAQAGAPVGHPARDRGDARRPVAQHEPTGTARGALVARAVQREHHVIPGLHRRHTVANCSPRRPLLRARAPSGTRRARSDRARRAGPTRRCRMQRRARAPRPGRGASTSISSSAAAPSRPRTTTARASHGVTSTAGPTIERS